MPWSVSDVDSHKKGLTPAQKKSWVKIANRVLKDCISAGGTDKTCAPKAIRIANSSFGFEYQEFFRKEGLTIPLNMAIDKSTNGETMKKKTFELPEIALKLTDIDCFAKAVQAGEGKNGLDMVVYSGGVIRDHWWWGNLAIDLGGIQFSKSKYPILENHRNDKKIAFTNKKPETDGKVVIDSVTYVDTEESLEFRKLSKEGFPYEASMYAIPTVVERVERDASVNVNNFTFKGPGTVWRKCIFKEASVCVFGYDSNTRSVALSESDQIISIGYDEVGDERVKLIKRKEAKKDMEWNLENFRKEAPDEYQKFVDQVKVEAEAGVHEKMSKLTERIDELTGQLNTGDEGGEKKLKETIDAQEKKIEDQDKKINALEKENIIRHENEMKSGAVSLFKEKLVESSIPEHLHTKVITMVSYTQFVKEGKLDTEEYLKAVDAEIEDWERKGVTSEVLGTGFATKTAAGEDKKVKEAEDEEWIKEMHSLADQEHPSANA